MGKRKAMMRTAGEGTAEGGRDRARGPTAKRKQSSAARGPTGRASTAAPVRKAPKEWLAVGEEVELCAQVEGYLGAWFQVRITELSQFEAAVDYSYFSETPGGQTPHSEVAPLENLRPLPPHRERKSWEALDAVETLAAAKMQDDSTWWQGYVQSFNPKTQTYRVCYEHGHPSLDLPAERIRTRLDWVPASPGSSKGYWARAPKMQVKPRKRRTKPPTKSAFTPGAESPPVPESPESPPGMPEAASSPSSGGGAFDSAFDSSGEGVEITPVLHPFRDGSTSERTRLGLGAYRQLLQSFCGNEQEALTEARVRILDDIQMELDLPADRCAEAHCSVYALRG